MNNFVHEVVKSGKLVYDDKGIMHHVVDVKKIAELWHETYKELEDLERSKEKKAKC